MPRQTAEDTRWQAAITKFRRSRLTRAEFCRRRGLSLGSDEGGRTAAVLMSLVPSCRRLGNEPFAYLRDVLDRVSTHPASRVVDVLADRRVLPSPSDGRRH